MAVFSAKAYDRAFLEEANSNYGHELIFFEPRLTRDTALLARGFEAVCVFVNDQVDARTVEALHDGGVRLIALRCAGYNNVDLVAAQRLNMTVVRVPAYSPHAVAEHTIALLLALNRRIHRAYARVREGNFALDGLLGFELHSLTAGIIGTGRIGTQVARILAGFGCRILAYDVFPNAECTRYGVTYTTLQEVLVNADILTLHCPLTPETYHLIDASALKLMKDGVVLINTSRGALIDASAVIAALKSGKIGHLGLDVYEEETDLFFEDLSNQVIQDDVFARLLTFPNVIVTGHQAFFTRTALQTIAQTTLSNIREVEQGSACANALTVRK